MVEGALIELHQICYSFAPAVSGDVGSLWISEAAQHLHDLGRQVKQERHSAVVQALFDYRRRFRKTDIRLASQCLRSKQSRDNACLALCILH